MELQIYVVDVDNTVRHALSFLPRQEVFGKSLPNKAIIGYVRNLQEPLIPKNIYLNPIFLNLFHHVIKETSASLDACRKEAERQKEGYVYIIDPRDKNYPNTKQADIIGTFQVSNGKLIFDSYRPNPEYQIVSIDGFSKLPDIFFANLLSEIRK